jgi:outer membrane protein assembly factor BamB
MSQASEPEQPTTSVLDRLITIGFFVGLAAIIFVIGMLTSISQTPPYRTVRDAWIAFCAVQAKNDLLASPWPAYLWTPTEQTALGVTTPDTSHASPGYTVYTSTHDGGATLVNLAGEEVHHWAAPFRKIWPHARHVPSWVPDQFVHMRKAHVYPNGDLLAVYSTTANTPSGCGLAKLDRDGNTLWTFDANAHHDFDIAADGTVYALTHQLRHLSDEDGDLASLADVPLIEDSVTILDADGHELKTFSLLDALVESPYFRPILCHVDRFGDIMHTNTIDVIGHEFASQYEAISPGDVMVCLRNLGLMVVVNPESEQIVWATTGPWNQPHDPDPLPSGNLLIFDNYHVRGTQHGSAVVEFDPRNSQVVWSYEGSRDAPLRSDIRARQQLLPNGNVLVTDSDNGRLVEITRDGTIAWEFFNPVRGGENSELIPVVCGGHRYTADELPFLNDPRQNHNGLAAAEPQ